MSRGLYLLNHEIGISHQALIHSMCSFSAFADGPYDERLSSVHIAGDEYIFNYKNSKSPAGYGQGVFI